jgi:pimeloyl-ACP methyl ester carboxylesterase
MTKEKFSIDIPQADIDDLRQRLAMTRWPGDLGNDSWHYGAQEAFLRDLLDDWAKFDWRSEEVRMNELPHFTAVIDGQKLHYVHTNQGKPAVVLLGGWPWTFWDFEQVIDGLKDSFDVIVPELPGYGFSSPLARTGIGFVPAADMIHTLLVDELGYDSYCVYGGDWGALTAEQLAHKYPDQVRGLHVSMPFPLDFAPIDASLWSEDEAPYAALTAAWWEHGTAYFQMHAGCPQTVAFLSDSPVAMAAWLVEKLNAWSDHAGDVHTAYPRDKMLATLSIYWFTQCLGSSARFYAESLQNPWSPCNDASPTITVPTAIAAFPKEVAQVPRAWAEKYFNLVRYNRLDRGGHFPAVENASALLGDMSEFFSAL